MSYLAQDQYKKAGAGMINIAIAIGAAIGIYLMTRDKKKKTTKSGYSRRRHQKTKVRPLPR